MIGMAILYLVGARRLLDVMGDPKKKKSPRLLEIVSTARKVAALILTGVMVSQRVVAVWCHSNMGMQVSSKRVSSIELLIIIVLC